jgi:misacylated tRNA(Ala) deacylase
MGTISFDGIVTQVVKVKKIDGAIRHFIQGEMPKQDATVHGSIDWERRFRLMRTHTAMHAISAVVWREYQAQVTGGNFEPLKGRLDFEFETLTAAMTSEIEDKVNAEISKGLGISAKILPREEAEKIPDLIRTKVNLLPPSLTEIRVVSIAGLDVQADGGTHVKNTSEIGTIKIVGYKSKGRINKRIKIEIV